jgi:hypothetical protein
MLLTPPLLSTLLPLLLPRTTQLRRHALQARLAVAPLFLLRLLLARLAHALPQKPRCLALAITVPVVPCAFGVMYAVAGRVDACCP